MMEDMETTEPTSPAAKTNSAVTWALRLVVAVVALAVLLIGAAYATSPEAIRHPKGTHYHFRMVLVNDGKEVDFSSAAFQTEFNKDICSAKLTKEPVHFHDGVGQFVHIHWAGMTGGLVLKQYGWNLIGGMPGLLGVRFDQLPWLAPVNIHGNALPKPPAGSHYFVYTGDEDHYTGRQWNDFLHQNLEDFFNKHVTARATPWDWLVPAAEAHGDDDKLTELNHVLGNVVIFAQKDKPADAQVKARFQHLVPLPQSACGG
jgi:hypothetical protein